MLRALSHGGDGDEVEAIERVEQLFGIAFATEDCQQFVTVGDLWTAVLKETKMSEAEAEPYWEPFAKRLCEETGDDWRAVWGGTLLLAEPLFNTLKRWWRGET